MSADAVTQRHIVVVGVAVRALPLAAFLEAAVVVIAVVIVVAAALWAWGLFGPTVLGINEFDIMTF